MAKGKTKPKTEKEPPVEVQPGETWMCCLCDDKPHFEGKRAFFGHCDETHAELVQGSGEERTIAANRGLGSHTDVDTWYSWDYAWMLPDGRQLGAQSIVRPRAKNDPMRH